MTDRMTTDRMTTDRIEADYLVETAFDPHFAAEVMVDGDQMHLIRRRETVAELFAGEVLLP